MASESHVAEAVTDAGRLPLTYAQALLGAAGNASEECLEELRWFVKELLPQAPGLMNVLTSNFVSQDEKERLLSSALDGKASAVFVNFVKVLARNGRMPLLSSILGMADNLIREQKKQVLVHIRSAVPLDSESMNVVVERMRSILQREPVVQVEVDPSLLGGVVIRVGDTLLDGSVAARLKKFRSAMIDRSIHEIQYGRDRFHSATRD